jgi:hypothetical protein
MGKKIGIYKITSPSDNIYIGQSIDIDNIINSVVLIKGYEVRNCHPYYTNWACGDNFCSGWRTLYSLDYYLDNNKQKISDDITVWFSK